MRVLYLQDEVIEKLMGFLIEPSKEVIIFYLYVHIYSDLHCLPGSYGSFIGKKKKEKVRYVVLSSKQSTMSLVTVSWIGETVGRTLKVHCSDKNVFTELFNEEYVEGLKTKATIKKSSKEN